MSFMWRSASFDFVTFTSMRQLSFVNRKTMKSNVLLESLTILLLREAINCSLETFIALSIQIKSKSSILQKSRDQNNSPEVSLLIRISFANSILFVLIILS
ncbi:hypothetical protein HWI79_723 [Cryptosporidium felis]|nr:hypothetical protein HWI79_723 [Cryptosporidium felis]